MRLVSPKLKGSKSVEGTAAVVGGQGCRSTSEVRTRSCLYSASFHALSLQSLFRNEPLTAMGFNENSSRKKRTLLSLGSKCSRRISCMHIQGRGGGQREWGRTHDRMGHKTSPKLTQTRTLKNGLLHYALCMPKTKLYMLSLSSR